jgi:hypothetical protein
LVDWEIAAEIVQPIATIEVRTLIANTW